MLAQKLLNLPIAFWKFYKPVDPLEKKRKKTPKPVRPTHLANVGLYEYPEYNSINHKTPPKGIPLALPVPGGRDSDAERKALTLEKAAKEEVLKRNRAGKKSQQRQPLSRSPSVPSIVEETQAEIDGFVGNYVYTEGIQAALFMQANSMMALSGMVAADQAMPQVPARAILAPSIENRYLKAVERLPEIGGEVHNGGIGNKEVEEEDEGLEMVRQAPLTRL